MMVEDEATFSALTQRISETSGLALSAYKHKCLKRRIAVRMRACGVHTYTDYLALLNQSSSELDRLLDALTINVTKFFRNRETWDQVAAIVVPDLLAGHRPRLRIWSAGCASGEEPYTLAMIFADLAEQRGDATALERLTIDATDIDRLSLERAREGRYPETAFSETPPEALRKHCARESDDTYRVATQLRRRVEVQRHDLTVDPAPHPPYDLIVCRNVIIYFDRPTQERLMELFREALVPGGYLVLGKVETIFGPARGRLELVEARERIYRRPG